MNRIITIAAALLAGSVSLASAERYEPAATTPFGTQTEVTAGSLLNSKDMHRRGVLSSDMVSVTVAPAGAQDSYRSDNH